MNISYISYVGVIVLLLTSGCTTTKASRRVASETMVLLQGYKQVQADQYKILNEHYEAESGALSDRIQDLMSKNAQNVLDSEALHIADQLLQRWEIQTSPSVLQDTFLQTVRSDFDKLRSLETAIDNLNDRFNRGFQKIEARMDSFQKIESNLRAQSEDSATRKKQNEAQRLLLRATN
jgi:hypothetical protein